MSYIVRVNHEKMAVVEKCEVLNYHNLTEKYICKTEIGEFARNKEEIFEAKEDALNYAISKMKAVKEIILNMCGNIDAHLLSLEMELISERDV